MKPQVKPKPKNKPKRISSPAVSVTPPHPKAVIHIGAKSVTMFVGEHTGGTGLLRRLDFLEKPAPVAQDIFQVGNLSPDTIDICVGALSTYLNSLKEYGIDPAAHPPRIVITNILSEAVSQEALLNRVHMVCGMDVEPLDDGEMTRLVFVRATHLFEQQPELAKKKVLVLHIGPGNTRALYFKKGRVAAYASYRLGSIRIRSSIQHSGHTQEGVRAMTRGQVRGHIDQIHFDFAKMGVEQIVTIGTEIQAAASVGFASKNGMCELPVKRLEQLIDQLEKQTTDKIVHSLKVDYFTADSMVPALHTNLALAKKFNIESLTTTTGNFEEGLLFDLLSPNSSLLNFQQEVIQSAIQLAQKFQTDLKHGQHVETLCLQLFDNLQPIHRLSQQDRLILRVAAILHESGSFVSRKAHHQHSYYLISKSDIFGLSQMDTNIAAQVARYHRHSPPRESHEEYHDLPRAARMRVSKLAAIIRVADALEKGHDQRIRNIRLETRDRTLHIIVSGTPDLRIEQLAMESKGDLFRTIYGMDILLEAEKS